MTTERKNFALLAGCLALLLGFYVTLTTLREVHEAQLADRFAAAAELLGKTDLASRLGGIYALERLAGVSETAHLRMVEVLTVYIRERVPIDSRPSAAAIQPFKRLPADLQACLAVLGRRSREYAQREPQRLNLARVDLRGANLTSAHLEDANLTGAWLQKSNLTHAVLTKVLLKDAHLEEVGLDRADLSGAFLGGTHLEGASLKGTILRDTYLVDAHLEGTNLLEADFRGAFGLTWDQVKLAQRNQQTRFPDELRTVGSWTPVRRSPNADEAAFRDVTEP